MSNQSVDFIISTQFFRWDKSSYFKEKKNLEKFFPNFRQIFEKIFSKARYYVYNHKDRKDV